MYQAFSRGYLGGDFLIPLDRGQNPKKYLSCPPTTFPSGGDFSGHFLDTFGDICTPFLAPQARFWVNTDRYFALFGRFEGF